MNIIEFTVPKNPEECLSIIKKSFPGRYDYFELYDPKDGNYFRMKKYEYVEKRDRLRFNIYRFWGPQITIDGYMEKCSENETSFTLFFNSHIIMIIIFWMFCALLFVSSLFFIFAIIFGLSDASAPNVQDTIMSIFCCLGFDVIFDSVAYSEQQISKG